MKIHIFRQKYTFFHKSKKKKKPRKNISYGVKYIGSYRLIQ